MIVKHFAVDGSLNIIRIFWIDFLAVEGQHERKPIRLAHRSYFLVNGSVGIEIDPRFGARPCPSCEAA